MMPRSADGMWWKEALENRVDLKARIYIALANNMQEDKRHYQWENQFCKLLKENKSPDLKVDFRYFEDEKHLTVTIPATYYGLRYLFEPYNIDINEVTIPQCIGKLQCKNKKGTFL